MDKEAFDLAEGLDALINHRSPLPARLLRRLRAKRVCRELAELETRMYSVLAQGFRGSLFALAADKFRLLQPMKKQNWRNTYGKIAAGLERVSRSGSRIHGNFSYLAAAVPRVLVALNVVERIRLFLAQLADRSLLKYVGGIRTAALALLMALRDALVHGIDIDQEGASLDSGAFARLKRSVRSLLSCGNGRPSGRVTARRLIFD